ncbi:hypothetical protein E2C01_023597 [Portunus trituberculatus]|uniref:Uncharacterized protein n=1 Tax=Portunus trituberculatus TaxID=210409 RepID=A0A5B7EAZ5_PORTR|nr:hypothetical protein [Portunus trituberculatus]
MEISSEGAAEEQPAQIIGFHRAGLQTREIVVKVGVSEGSVIKWLRRFKDDGGVELPSAKPWPGASKKTSVCTLTMLKRQSPRLGIETVLWCVLGGTDVMLTAGTQHNVQKRAQGITSQPSPSCPLRECGDGSRLPSLSSAPELAAVCGAPRQPHSLPLVSEGPNSLVPWHP